MMPMYTFDPREYLFRNGNNETLWIAVRIFCTIYIDFYILIFCSIYTMMRERQTARRIPALRDTYRLKKIIGKIEVEKKQ